MFLPSFLLYLKHLDEKTHNHVEIVNIREDVNVQFYTKSRQGRPRAETGHKSSWRHSRAFLFVGLLLMSHQACDMCRKKKIRCEPTADTCEQCIKYRTLCHFTPISVKRKPRRLPE